MNDIDGRLIQHNELHNEPCYRGLTVKNIPNTLGGPSEWYPGANIERLPSVAGGVTGASGPSRTLHGQDYPTPRRTIGPGVTRRNYGLNPEPVLNGPLAKALRNLLSR